MRTCFVLGASFVAASLFLASPAHARGYYFNKPGVSREAYVADVTECTELAAGARAGDVPTPYNPNLIATGVVALFAGMARSADRRRISRMIERTCMADRGYMRYEVNNAVINEIARLPTEAEQMERLFGLASSSRPIGQRVVE